MTPEEEVAGVTFAELEAAMFDVIGMARQFRRDPAGRAKFARRAARRFKAAGMERCEINEYSARIWQAAKAEAGA